MGGTVRTPRVAREQFLNWADAQEARYEFDPHLPEVGIEVPVPELHEGVEFGGGGAGSAG